MKTTCAVLLTDNSNLLIVHPTNSSELCSWGLPKGIVDEGENYDDAAIRELYEETSLKYSKSDLVFIDIFDYHKNKNYALFKLVVDEMPSLNSLKCMSYIDNTNVFEIDKFKIIKYNEIEKYLNKKQFKIVSSVLL